MRPQDWVQPSQGLWKLEWQNRLNYVNNFFGAALSLSITVDYSGCSCQEIPQIFRDTAAVGRTCRRGRNEALDCVLDGIMLAIRSRYDKTGHLRKECSVPLKLGEFGMRRVEASVSYQPTSISHAQQLCEDRNPQDAPQSDLLRRGPKAQGDLSCPQFFHVCFPTVG